MKRIPPELDQLMWLVAEANDAKALEDFERQYPEHVAELGKRLALVRGLRGAKVPEGKSHSLPVFRPSPYRPTVRRWNWLVATPALVALAAASYFVTGAVLSQSRPKVVQAPAPLEQVPLDFPSPKSNQPVWQPPGPRPVERITPPPPLPAYLRPQTVVMERARLEDALRSIGAACGLDLEIAPGLADLEVSLEYRGWSGIDMLKDMGPRFGFTAFSQGGNRVLVVPAVDAQASAEPVAPADPEGGGNRLERSEDRPDLP